MLVGLVGVVLPALPGALLILARRKLVRRRARARRAGAQFGARATLVQCSPWNWADSASAAP
jgi:uncharacterized protein YqgC (DUF456 family)